MRSQYAVAVIAFAMVVVACSGLEPLDETLVEDVEVASVTLPGAWLDPFMPPIADGRPATISGALRVPPTDAPLPAVILTHGCGGISGAELGWARELEAAGIASLVLDDFTGREIVSGTCTGEEGINQGTLLVDLYRAVDTLAAHPYIDGSRIAVMGFSAGGRTALWAGLERFQDLYDGRPLAGYLAFYPLGCYIQLENESDTRGGPVRVFHGAVDNWLPITQCETYVDRLRLANVDIELTAYPGAHHSFDDRGLPHRVDLFNVMSPRNCAVVEHDGVLTEVSSGEPATTAASCIERGGSIGYNAEAREQAVVDVLAFLDTIFTP